MERNCYPLYEVTSYGIRLNGKPGCTGKLIARLSPEDIASQHTNAVKHGETIVIKKISEPQGE